MACTALICAQPMESKTPSIWDVLTAVTGTLLTIAGVIYSYVQNGGRTGYDFIQKSIVLGWVLSIRLIVLIIVFAVVFAFLKSSFGHLDESSWENLLCVVVIGVIYYQRLGKHLKDTNNVNGEPKDVSNPSSPDR